MLYSFWHADSIAQAFSLNGLVPIDRLFQTYQKADVQLLRHNRFVLHAKTFLLPANKAIVVSIQQISVRSVFQAESES